MNNCIYCNYSYCGGCGKTKCTCGSNTGINRTAYLVCQRLGITNFGIKDEKIKEILEYIKSIEGTGDTLVQTLEHFGYTIPKMIDAVEDEKISMFCKYSSDTGACKCSLCGYPKRWKDTYAKDVYCKALVVNE